MSESHLFKPSKHETAQAPVLKALTSQDIAKINTWWESGRGQLLTNPDPESVDPLFNVWGEETMLRLQSLVKDNPLLTSALAEIRDGYYQLLHEKTQILNHFEGLDKPFKGLMTHLIKSRDPQKKIMLNEVDVKLGVHNFCALHRLMERNYGFSEEAAAAIAGVPETGAKGFTEGLSQQDAKLLFEKTLGNALRAFKKWSHIEVEIPNSYLKPSEAAEAIEKFALHMGRSA